MLVAAIVILAGVVVVASGRGGEMAPEYPDYPPIDLGPVTAADVALLRPPSAAWGYNMRVTDEALETIAAAVTERDVKISVLQQEVADLREELARDWARRTGDAGAEADGPDEGPTSTQPPWAEPQMSGSGTAGPPRPEGEAPESQTAAPGAVLHEVTPPQGTSHEDSSYEESAHEESPHGESFHGESFHGEPVHGIPAHDIPAHAAAQPPASDDADDQDSWDEPGQDSWDEPHQTLVWGAEHQRAKASRLQEQRQATQPQDVQDTPPQGMPSADVATQDTPTQDTPTQDTPGRDTPGQEIPSADTSGPASADHWAEVTAPSHYEDARQPVQAEQDRE
jgi:hypothetical protein